MRRVAHNIEIIDEIKSDTVVEEGYSYTYEYKEVHIKDEKGDVLETFRVGIDIETDEQFFNSTGVRLGLSAWITED